MNDLLSRTWDWRVLTRECPSCAAVVAEDVLQHHSDWHWLTQTTPREVAL